MRRLQFMTRTSPLLTALAVQGRALADTTGSDGATAPPAAPTWAGAVSVVIVLLIGIVAIAVAAKLYDQKRKREEEAMSAQAYVGDMFLREFGTIPIAVSATGSFWRRSPLVLSIRGTVPTPELREAVIRLAKQELLRQYPTAQIEDHLFVDPLITRERAGRV